MSQGTMVKASVGNTHKDVLYIQLKNNSVYRHPKRMTTAQMTNLVIAIKEKGGRVQLKNWVKAR